MEIKINKRKFKEIENFLINEVCFSIEEKRMIIRSNDNYFLFILEQKIKKNIAFEIESDICKRVLDKISNTKKKTEKIKITINEDHIVIDGKKIKYTEIDNFNVDQKALRQMDIINCEEFYKLLKSSYDIIKDLEDGREFLGFVRLEKEKEDNEIKIISTNGFSLSINYIELHDNQMKNESFVFHLYKNQVKSLLNLLELYTKTERQTKDLIRINIKNNSFSVYFFHFHISFPEMEHRNYPDYNKIIPKEFKKNIKIQKTKDLLENLQSLKKASKPDDNDYIQVYVKVEKNRMIISNLRNDRDNYIISSLIHTHIENENENEFDFFCNLNILVDIIEKINPNKYTKTNIKFIDNKNPISINDVDSKDWYLFMPMLYSKNRKEDIIKNRISLYNTEEKKEETIPREEIKEDVTKDEKKEETIPTEEKKYYKKQKKEFSEIIVTIEKEDIETQKIRKILMKEDKIKMVDENDKNVSQNISQNEIKKDAILDTIAKIQKKIINNDIKEDELNRYYEIFKNIS